MGCKMWKLWAWEVLNARLKKSKVVGIRTVSFMIKCRHDMYVWISRPLASRRA